MTKNEPTVPGFELFAPLFHRVSEKISPGSGRQRILKALTVGGIIQSATHKS